ATPLEEPAKATSTVAPTSVAREGPANDFGNAPRHAVTPRNRGPCSKRTRNPGHSENRHQRDDVVRSGVRTGTASGATSADAYRTLLDKFPRRPEFRRIDSDGSELRRFGGDHQVQSSTTDRDLLGQHGDRGQDHGRFRVRNLSLGSDRWAWRDATCKHGR